ncbi:MAG: hypothetical protein EOO07_27700 [Chitinophagaceae bacterium]|nr:MAG: hypothetical protein EOO07_27700 [Chitinophagaceae bacterium]
MENSETIEKIIAKSYANVLWMSYPHYPQLTTIVEERLAVFNRCDYEERGAGLYGAFKKVFGWKIARRLQLYFYRLKYHRQGPKLI